MDEAILNAKRLKEEKQKADLRRQRENENRALLTEKQWGFEQTKGFMLHRAGNLFEGKFKIDDESQPLFDLLCMYFANDSRFVTMAEKYGIENPALNKGLCLAGNFGVGKTWLMKLFCRNQRQVFHLVSAKVIANTFETSGEDGIEIFIKPQKNPVNDASSFYQTFAGLCIDDLGTEDVKTHYGNRKNVVGDLIELRYSNKATGPLLHATTNLTSDQLSEFYGGRIRSRLREIVNWIELPGNDKRK